MEDTRKRIELALHVLWEHELELIPRDYDRMKKLFNAKKVRDRIAKEAKKNHQ